LSLAALQSCVSQLRSRRCFVPSSVRHPRTVAAGLRYSTIVTSPSSTPQIGRSPVFVRRRSSLTLLTVFTGSEHPSVSSLNWRSLSHDTELSTALHRGICLICCTTSLICRQQVDLIHDLLFLPISTIQSAVGKRLITHCCVTCVLRLACSRLSGHIEQHSPDFKRESNTTTTVVN